MGPGFQIFFESGRVASVYIGNFGQGSFPRGNVLGDIDSLVVKIIFFPTTQFCNLQIFFSSSSAFFLQVPLVLLVFFLLNDLLVHPLL